MAIWSDICSIYLGFLYRSVSEQHFNSYMAFGLILAFANLIFVFTFAFMNINEFLEAYGAYSAVIISLLNLIIPFSFYFVLISFVIVGFHIPFDT
jgi:hypothetical protein